jgi:hypothetical protein
VGFITSHSSNHKGEGTVSSLSILTFLQLLRLKNRSLASIGAAIVLLTIPFDLCFQQLIFFPEVWVNATTIPTVPRATIYTPIDDGTFFQNGTFSQKPNPTMSQVVEPFFYSNGSLPDLDIYCPTSNCTWDPFQTLAVCSACDSTVGQELEFGCIDGPADWLPEVSSYGGDISLYPNASQCGWFLNISSDSRVLMTGYTRDPVTFEPGEALTVRLFNLVDVFTREPYYGGSLQFKDVMDPILDFMVVATPGGVSAVYRNETPVAHECVLTWCTQTLNTSYYWGTLTENISNPFMNNTEAPFPWTVVQEPDFTDFIYTANITLDPPQQHSTEPSNGNEAVNLTFGLTNLTMTSIIFMADEIVPAMITAENSTADAQFKYVLFDPDGARTRPLRVNPWLPPNNITAHVEQIAQAMTTVVRNSPAADGSQDMMKGTSWELQKNVQTRWPWVILPVVLVCLTLIFLIYTVVVSTQERSKIGIWKTNATAVLIASLGEEVHRSFGSNCSTAQARMKARELKVKLVAE